jgi:hypothetical protein
LSDVGNKAPSRHVLVLRIPPEWDAAKGVWDPCHRMLRENGLSEDEAYQLSMVAQELLENAVKYGKFEAREEVALELRVSSEYVTLEVKNPLGVDNAHLREFDRAIQWIRSYSDPFEAYVERMKLVSGQPYGHGKSGLGLTRIAYEGRCILDFYVDDTNTLAVSAVYRREA